MDGFESDVNVIVIAATNRPEALDPALCRPGRFSRKVFVGEPDEGGRRKILAVHLRGIPLEEDNAIMCNLIASLTQGFVGADLANIVNEAALLAARRGLNPKILIPLLHFGCGCYTGHDRTEHGLLLLYTFGRLLCGTVLNKVEETYIFLI